jgi:hypothetical protein
MTPAALTSSNRYVYVVPSGVFSWIVRAYSTNINVPSNEDLVKAGHAVSCAATAVRFPVNFDAPYDFISFDGTSSLVETEEGVRIEGQGNEDGKMAIPICLP